MDTALSYLISVGLIAFGVWIVVVAAKAAPGSLLVWTLVGLIPVVIGLISLFSEIRNDNAA
jgi:NhaP-type Na+/H+ or K+/H+ antiporter